MPVLGHAFVGLSAAACTRPAEGRGGRLVGSVMWTPIIVALAYLPDIAGQIGSVLGWSEARAASHSVLFAVCASAVAGPLLAAITSLSMRRAAALTLVMILSHDLLDMLQATDRTPWWPISRRPMGLGLEIIPVDPLREAVVFGGAFVLFVTVRRVLARRAMSPIEPLVHRGGWLVWVSRLALAAILGIAMGTHHLRHVREAQYEWIKSLLGDRDYAAVLDLIAETDHWPYTAKPGRLDYTRAEAYLGLDDRNRAEEHYLRSLAADASYFWCVADLAVLYASADEPAADRRQRVAPLVRRLRTDFADHPDAPRFLDKIDRRLERPPH